MIIAIFVKLAMMMINNFHQKITKKKILSSNLFRSLLKIAAIEEKRLRLEDNP
jgi:hypothetical protein